MHIDIHDWRLEVEGTTFRARPSGHSVARQLWVTLLAAVLAGLLVWLLGLPPGSRTLQRERARVDRLEQQARQLRQQADRLAGSATAGNPRSVAAQMRQRSLEEAKALQARVQRERAALARRTPTLGPVGDALYWTALAGLTLLGVGLPLLAPLARLTLRYEGPPGRGTLVVRQWFILGRTRRFETADFLLLGVHVLRLVSRHRPGGTLQDHGWVWKVFLLDARRGDQRPALQFLVEHSPTLPPDRAMVTPRARVLVRYLEAVTALPASAPVVTDVIDDAPGWLRSGWRTASRRIDPGNRKSG